MVNIQIYSQAEIKYNWKLEFYSGLYTVHWGIWEIGYFSIVKLSYFHVVDPYLLAMIMATMIMMRMIAISTATPVLAIMMVSARDSWASMYCETTTGAAVLE